MIIFQFRPNLDPELVRDEPLVLVQALLDVDLELDHVVKNAVDFRVQLFPQRV